MAEKLEFDLIVKANQLGNVLDEATSKSKTLQSTISTALGVFAGNLATKGFEILGNAIGEANRFAQESIKAFTEQEDALNRLSQALKASGDFSESAVTDFSAFASELQRTSRFGDEVVLSQLAVAKSLGASNEKAKELVLAAANLSATFGGSLDENLIKVGKTLSGEVGRLGQLIPALKDLTDEQLRAGDVADIINRKFGGAAANELNTYSGSVIATNNALSDLQEEIGGLLVNVLNLQEKNSFLKSIYEDLTQSVADFNTELRRNSDGFKEDESSINQLARRYAELTEEIENQQAILERQSQNRFSVRAAGEAKIAKDNVAALTKEYDALFKKINEFQPDGLENIQPESNVIQLTKEQIDERQKRNQAILAIDEQLRAEQLAADSAFEQTKITDEFARQEAELQRILEFETLKAEAEFNLKQQEIERTLSGEEQRLAVLQLAKEKELKLTQLSNANIVKEQDLTNKKTIKTQEELAKEERFVLQSRFQAASAFLSLGQALSRDGSIAARTFASANALVQTYAGANQVLGDPAIPTLAKPPLVAATIANGLANVARINGVQFEQGGVVGGASMGPDNRVATIRDGEMVLNASQQKNLMDMLNSGGTGGDIVVQIDGREIARAVRNQKQLGFAV